MREFAGVTNERPTAAAHRVVAEVVKPGDLVVDATAGNGHDTLFLANLVGEEGKVLAFDVQEAAVQATRSRVEVGGLGKRVELFAESHMRMLDRAGRGTVAAAMFNLGYLPGGDHGVITEAAETCGAITQGLFALKTGGVMTVVCYTGHQGGALEAAAVVMGLKEIRNAGTVEFDLEVGEPSKEDAPFLVVVRKCQVRSAE